MQKKNFLSNFHIFFLIEINCAFFRDETGNGGAVSLDAEVEKGLQNATDLELTDLAAVLGLRVDTYIVLIAR